jgi:hypothetical protein
VYKRQVLVGWILVRRVGDLVRSEEERPPPGGWFHEWRLDRPLAAAFAQMGLEATEVRHGLVLLRVLLRCESWYAAGEGLDPLGGFLDGVLADPGMRAFLGINEYRGVVWFRSESFDELLAWLTVVAAVETGADREVAKAVEEMVLRLAAAKESSECRLADLLAAVRTGERNRDNGAS